MISKLHHSACISLCCLAFTLACSGGGGGSKTPAAAPPASNLTPQITAPSVPQDPNAAPTSSTSSSTSATPTTTTTSSSTSNGATTNNPGSTGDQPATGANNPTTASIPVLGTADGLEIGCWNIEDYPKSTRSKGTVSNILNTMDVDVMGVEEITSVDAFNDLLSAMPKFTGVIVGDDKNNAYEDRNVGLIYRTSDFTVVDQQALFPKDTYSFPRPPLMVRLHPNRKDRADIVVIVVHLKAFGDDKSQARRKKANTSLESYVADLETKEPALQVIVLGDFNQPLVDASDRVNFDPWYQNENLFKVLTDPLVAEDDYSYYAGRQSLIDHMIATTNFNLEVPEIPKLQTLVPSYQSEASDHLPVVTKLMQ